MYWDPNSRRNLKCGIRKENGVGSEPGLYLELKVKPKKEFKYFIYEYLFLLDVYRISQTSPTRVFSNFLE